MHRGAIYSYRPIFWIDHPLWILRNLSFSPPRRATILRYPDKAKDAFRQSLTEQQESVIATAKARHVVIWSRTKHALSRGFNEVVVLPTYTIDRDRHSEEFIDRLVNERFQHLHYLADDPSYSVISECYIDFQKLRQLKKEFLADGKLDICLSDTALRAIMSRFINFLG